MTASRQLAITRISATVLCVLLISSCKTLDSPDPCALSHLEQVSEPLAEEGDFKGLYEMYLPCAQKGVPEAEYFLAFLIGTDADSEILELDDTRREAEALKWTCRSALHGHQEAIETIADSYYWGWFALPRDPEKEACWRRRLEDPEASIECECHPD